MDSRVEIVDSTDRIDVVLRRLIKGLREEHAFEKITIVIPSNQSSFYFRRALAQKGLFNVDFKRLEDVAETLGGSDFSQPLLHDLQASEFVYESARDITLGPDLGGDEVSPQLHNALHFTFRELELLDSNQLDQLADQGGVFSELVNRFHRYMTLASGHRRGHQVSKRAAEIITSGEHSELVKTMGTVVLVNAFVSPVHNDLYKALSNMPDAIIVSIDDSETEGEPLQRSGKDSQGLHLRSVPDTAEEIRDVVREILRLARCGKRFGNLAVVFEDESYATRIGEALEFAGIPVSGPDRIALSETPEGRFVIGLLNIYKNDFNRLDLTTWLSSAPVKDPESGMIVPSARWDAISRTAGITSSVENSWLPRLDRYARNVVSQAERSEREGEGKANTIAAARSDAEHADRLKEFLIQLGTRRPSELEDSWVGFGRWLRSMVKDYFIGNDDPKESDEPDSKISRLLRLIDQMESLEGSGSKLPKYAHCSEVFREQLGHRSAGLRTLGQGVYVGPLWTAAGCLFDTVFMLGMSEGRYPSLGLTDPLLPEPVKKLIDPKSVYLKTVDTGVEEARHLFNLVRSSAETVFMYWPRSIPGESHTKGPARWFLESARLVSGKPLLQSGDLLEGELTGVTILRRGSADLYPVERAGDIHDFDLLSAHNWQQSGNDPNQFPLAKNFESLSNSMNFEIERNGSNWTEYDGRIAPIVAGSSLDQTINSATAFETYASCPYQYFLSHRLNVEPTASPEVEIGLDPLTFGSLIHAVLEAFSKWRMGDEFVEDPPDRQRQVRCIRDSTEEQIELLKEKTPGRSDGAWRIEKHRALTLLINWLRRESNLMQRTGMRQVKAEYEFGRNSVKLPVEVKTPAGGTVKFRGQVDRVDISGDNKQVIVYDYKSGSSGSYEGLKKDPLKKGTKLQLPIYSMAVAAEYPEAEVSAAYWFVRESGVKEFIPGESGYQKEQTESQLVKVVEKIISGIDRGVFPAHPGEANNLPGRPASFENCTYCDYERVCPTSKSRLWESKKNSDKNLESYLSLVNGDL